MKQTLFIMLLACLMAGVSKAGTISGTVTQAGGTVPLVNKKVYLADSVTGGGVVRLDSAFTTSTGGYSFTVASTITSGKLFIYTTACSYWSTSPSVIYSGSNHTINLTVGCTFGNVSGTVYTSSAGPVGSGVKVYLRDSSLTTGAILHFDSTFTNASGGYSFTVPASVITGYMSVYTYGCGSVWRTGFGWVGISQTSNLTLFCSPQYVYDTVKNSTSGIGVMGQKVYIQNSTATYKDSVLTNVHGVAQFMIPAAITSGSFTTSTLACGVQSQTFTYSGSTMIAPTLSVCVSNALVSGTLTNLSTSAGVPNHYVTLVDSVGSAIVHMDSTMTNSSGAFQFKLPLHITSGKMEVSSYGCGQQAKNSATFSGSNLTLNLGICATSTATISGLITNVASGAAVAGRKVYLTDSNTITGVVKYWDSTVSSATGAYSFTIAPSFVTAGFIIRVPSCGGYHVWSYAYYSGSSLVRNISVCGSVAPNATVTGNISRGSSLPIANAVVAIYGPTGTRVSTTTNTSGNYSLSIPNSWPSGYISWMDSSSCGMYYNYLNYLGASMVVNDTSCWNLRSIQGMVRLSPSTVAAGARVYLIGEVYDTTMIPIDTMLVQYDSTTTDANGYYIFNRTHVPYVTYRVKAALLPSHPNYSSYLPSYSDSAIMWRNASTFTSSAWYTSSISNFDIQLKGGSNPGGPGFIGGRVVLGANKNVGDPLDSRILILTTAVGKVIGYTYSDMNGDFSFPNLAYGSYLIFGDVWGARNPALNVTLSPGNTSVKNIIFEEDNSSFEGHYNLSVPGIDLQAVTLYPNPAKDLIILQGINTIAGAKTIIISDITGRQISSTQVPAGTNGRIITTDLTPGIYTLQVQTMEGTASFKLVKE